MTDDERRALLVTIEGLERAGQTLALAHMATAKALAAADAILAEARRALNMPRSPAAPPPAAS